SMSVRCHPDARRLLKRLRSPQSLHLFLKVSLVDVILEGLPPVDQYDGNQLAVLFFQLCTRFHIRHAQIKGHTTAYALNALFGVIAKMTAGARINIDGYQVTHLDEAVERTVELAQRRSRF